MDRHQDDAGQDPGQIATDDAADLPGADPARSDAIAATGWLAR